ncbi:MAG: metallophosphoesterase family protein [Actinomycetota bacterium]
MRLFVLALALLLSAPALAGERFTFAAIGDLPYVREDPHVLDPEAAANRDFSRLVERINASRPAFTVHVGDTKAGNTTCTDEHLAFIKARFFDRFDGPLVYTPGDNEWTDCDRKGGDPLVQLAHLRKLYFAQPHSLGRTPMKLTRQHDFPENALWTRSQVVFATLNVPGSNNDERQPEEFAARNAADLAWLRGAFARARSDKAKAVVLFMQANPGWFCTRKECTNGEGDGIANYRELLAALVAEVEAFPRPVLMVHGDTHVFTVDKPMRKNGDVQPRFTRLEVFGDTDSHAVLVDVDPDSPDVFGFRPLM